MPGLPHVSMYSVSDHESFADIYFGTQAEAAEEAEMNLQPSLSFGPATERTVTLGEVNPDGLIFVNLEKDEVMPSPFPLPVNPSDPDLFQRDARIDEWIESSGVDLAIHLKSANWGFVPLNTRLIFHQTGNESPDYFAQLSPEKVRSVIEAPESTRDYVVSLGGGVSAYPVSASYIFQTRQGAMGVLNITGFTNNPPGVKIRYKLLRQNEPPKQ